MCRPREKYTYNGNFEIKPRDSAERNVYNTSNNNMSHDEVVLRNPSPLIFHDTDTSGAYSCLEIGSGSLFAVCFFQKSRS